MATAHAGDEIGGRDAEPPLRCHADHAIEAFPKAQGALETLNLWNRSLPGGTRVSLQMTATSLDDPLAVSPASLFTCHLLPGAWRLLPLDLGLVSGDSLIVRREFAQHPRLKALLAHLRQRATELAALHGEVSLA